MSRALLVRNVASVTRETHHPSKVTKHAEIGNVQSLPSRRQTACTPKELVNARLYRTQAEQSARIAELEHQLQNLWHQYAGSRKQKLELLDTNATLETEICSLKKELAYETHMRGVAESKLEASETIPPP